jgi:6,7-dimethyl-8-ribityllumazine synthase
MRNDAEIPDSLRIHALFNVVEWGAVCWNFDYLTMSGETPNWNPALSARGLKVAVVVARFNRAITERLLDGARQALAETEADAVEVFWVPGAYELPLAAKRLAEEYDAVVTLGAVIRGDTPHFDYVAGECARGLPIAFGVLTTDTLEQAEARAGGAHGNKGHDAAMTAIEMAVFVK